MKKIFFLLALLSIVACEFPKFKNTIAKDYKEQKVKYPVSRSADIQHVIVYDLNGVPVDIRESVRKYESVSVIQDSLEASLFVFGEQDSVFVINRWKLYMAVSTEPSTSGEERVKCVYVNKDSTKELAITNTLDNTAIDLIEYRDDTLQVMIFLKH